MSPLIKQDDALSSRNANHLATLKVALGNPTTATTTVKIAASANTDKAETDVALKRRGRPLNIRRLSWNALSIARFPTDPLCQ